MNQIVQGVSRNFNKVYLKGVVLAACASICFSTSGIIIRQIETETEWQYLFYRSLILSLLMLFVIAARRRRGRVPSAAGTRWMVLAGGACLAAGSISVIFAMTHTTVAKVALLHSTGPLIAATLGLAILRERPSKSTWIAMIVALAGVVTMVDASLPTRELFGSGAALVAAISFAGFAVTLRLGRITDMLPAVCLGAVMATLASCLIALLSKHGLGVSATVLFFAVLSGIGQIGAGMLFFTAGSRHIPVAELVLLDMISVVLSPIWVWLGVGEVPSIRTLLGGIIVLFAVAGSAIAQNARCRASRHSLPQRRRLKARRRTRNVLENP